MSQMAVGFAEEVFIERLYNRVLMRLTKIHLLIRRVQNGCTFSLQIHVVADNSRLIRLTAAIDTASGATHNLDEVNLVSAVLHAIKQLCGIGSPEEFTRRFIARDREVR